MARASSRDHKVLIRNFHSAEQRAALIVFQSKVIRRGFFLLCKAICQRCAHSIAILGLLGGRKPVRNIIHVYQDDWIESQFASFSRSWRIWFSFAFCCLVFSFLSFARNCDCALMIKQGSYE